MSKLDFFTKRGLKRVFLLGLSSLAIVGAGLLAVPDYNRSEFKHWTDADGDCINTRNEVLIRDADANVVLSNDGCAVLSSVWIDPYTGEQFTNPKDLDVDHLVPLKNAWESGASAWDDKKREEYANYLGNNYHLIAVKASENRKKGAKAPHEYMPPNKDFGCQYAAFWVAVKDKWELSITEAESDFLLSYKTKCAGI